MKRRIARGFPDSRWVPTPSGRHVRLTQEASRGPRRRPLLQPGGASGGVGAERGGGQILSERPQPKTMGYQEAKNRVV
jgi:hypothetical protein